MNAGATIVGAETVLLCRVEDCRGISHLTVGTFAQRAHQLGGERPAHCRAPDEERTEREQWGLEDPRVTRVDELDCWVIAYTTYGASEDRASRWPPPPTSRGGRPHRDGHGAGGQERRPVAAAHRRAVGAVPPAGVGHDHASRHLVVPLDRSPQLDGPGARACDPRDGAWWDTARIGVGPPPIETERGLAHGVPRGPPRPWREALSRFGLALLDLDDPSRRHSAVATSGSSVPPPRTMSCRGTCRGSSSRAGWCTTPHRTSSASTTAPRTHRWASPPRPCRT